MVDSGLALQDCERGYEESSGLRVPDDVAVLSNRCCHIPTRRIAKPLIGKVNTLDQSGKARSGAPTRSPVVLGCHSLKVAGLAWETDTHSQPRTLANFIFSCPDRMYQAVCPYSSAPNYLSITCRHHYIDKT